MNALTADVSILQRQISRERFSATETIIDELNNSESSVVALVDFSSFLVINFLLFGGGFLLESLSNIPFSRRSMLSNDVQKYTKITVITIDQSFANDSTVLSVTLLEGIFHIAEVGKLKKKKKDAKEIWFFSVRHLSCKVTLLIFSFFCFDTF
jgi:hypothetical protein